VELDGSGGSELGVTVEAGHRAKMRALLKYTTDTAVTRAIQRFARLREAVDEMLNG